MKLLLISLNYAPELTGIGLYSGEFAQALSSAGCDVHVVCSYPFYPDWKRQDSHTQKGWTWAEEQNVSVKRCPCYIPSRVTGARRVLHYFSFACAALFPAISTAWRQKPDMVMVVAPALMSGWIGFLAARISRAKLWIHIQDYEVEAGFATGQMKKDSILGRIALVVERLTLSLFDRVSSISPEMCTKAVKKGVQQSRVYELRNWSDIEGIVPLKTSDYRRRWSIKTKHVALYSGSIAKKQGIEVIVDAARKLADRGDVTFVICGNGPTRADLEALGKGVPNLQFHGLQPLEELNQLLNLATVHLLPQKRDAADLVLPSKLANMLATGRPVVAGVEPGRGLAREVEGVGLICEPEDGASMADAIERLLDDKALYETCASEARVRAESRWSKEAIIAAALDEMKVMANHEAAPVSLRN